MTKKDALTIALTTLTASTYTNPSFDGKDTTRKEIPVEEVREVITKMIDQLSKERTPMSDEKKATLNEKRKTETAKARAELVATVAPVLREGLSHTLQGMTAKELFADTQSRLPADFSWRKVQNILIREMRPELVITETKGKANTYALASVVNA